jgi:hypothetical protein
VVHGDSSETQHRKSFPADAPWVALPYGSSKNSVLDSKFNEGYVPCLYVLNFEGKKVVTGRDTRADLSKGAAACYQKWLQAVQEG